jgi:hypothetical protein
LKHPEGKDLLNGELHQNFTQNRKIFTEALKKPIVSNGFLPLS